MSGLSEEEQLDNFKSFSKKYGSAIVTIILIALIAFFGWQYWQKKNKAESQNRTAKVQQLMDSAAAAESDEQALNNLYLSANDIIKEAPNSVQAVQTELLLAKIAYDKQDYAKAEKSLKKIENSELNDEGLLQIVKLRLAYAQMAQNKYDEALNTLSAVKDPAFKATADEARGDVYVAKKDVAAAQKAYKSAWDQLVEMKKERQILQIKLESVGVLVEDPDLERPILATQVDES